MESSPSKRRKISPRISVPVDATGTPSRIPVRRESTQTLTHRPSFASPTRASLARHNPQLLNRLSSGESVRAGGRGRNLDDVFAQALGQRRSDVEQQDRISGGQATILQRSTAVRNEAEPSGGRPPITTRPPARRSLGGGLSAKPRRISRSPAKQTLASVRSTTADTVVDQESQSSAHPDQFKRAGRRRTPIASEEVEVPESDPNPFQRRGLRRSPLSVSKLPTTGEENGPDITKSKPSGDSKSPLNSGDATSETRPASRDGSSPQRTVEDITAGSTKPNERLIEPAGDSPPISLTAPQPRRRLHQEDELELPPIPKELGVSDPVSAAIPIGIHDVPSSKAKKNRVLANKIQSSSPVKNKLPRKPLLAKESTSNSRAEEKSEPSQSEKPKHRKSARFLTLEDPHAAKKKARDDLLKDLQQLQADVALADQENKRLQLHYGSKRAPPSAPSNSEELLNLFIRSTAPDPPAKANATQTSPFKSIGSFLPFSSRRKLVSRLIPASDETIPSHLPIEIDNPLPYLQAFSPLTYTSKVTLLPLKSQTSDSSSSVSTQKTQSISQLHLITASHLSGLFTARLSMIVDTTHLSISSVDIERLPPNAEKELGNFLRDRFTQEGTSTKDIGLICWAMSRWVEVSILRARFWCVVEKELGTPEARAKNLQKKRKKRKRRLLVIEDDDEGPLNDQEEQDGEDELTKQKWTRRELLPHMGRTAMELATDKVELRIEWKIKFDWTGEADNSLTASARLPKSCECLAVFSPKCEHEC